MSKKEVLKVGDKIYRVGNTHYRQIEGIDEIVKITKTQAITKKGDRYKLEVDSFWGLQEIPKHSGSRYYSYELETEELKQRFETQNLKKEIEGKLHIVNLLLDKLEYKAILLLEDINGKLAGILNNINSIPKESEDERV